MRPAAALFLLAVFLQRSSYGLHCTLVHHGPFFITFDCNQGTSAHLLLHLVRSSTQLQSSIVFPAAAPAATAVEKAASGSAARLDSAHKAQCPWRGSSCDPSLLGFPGQTPESLHTSFMARCAALASLAALPVLEQAALRAMEHAALQAVPGSPRSRLEALLVLSEEVPPWQWQAEGGLPSGTRSKVLSVVEHSRTPGFQDPLASLSFAQVRFRV